MMEKNRIVLGIIEDLGFSKSDLDQEKVYTDAVSVYNGYMDHYKTINPQLQEFENREFVIEDTKASLMDEFNSVIDN